jgi:hypothetical protein
VVGCGLGVGGELFRFVFDGGGRRFGLFFSFSVSLLFRRGGGLLCFCAAGVV